MQSVGHPARIDKPYKQPAPAAPPSATIHNRAPPPPSATAVAAPSLLSTLPAALYATLAGFGGPAPSHHAGITGGGGRSGSADEEAAAAVGSEAHYLAVKSAYLAAHFDLQVGLPLRLVMPMIVLVLCLLPHLGRCTPHALKQVCMMHVSATM